MSKPIQQQQQHSTIKQINGIEGAKEEPNSIYTKSHKKIDELQMAILQFCSDLQGNST